MQAAGVCGTDRHLFKGEFPSKPPVTLGHVRRRRGRARRRGEPARRGARHLRPERLVRGLRRLPARQGQPLRPQRGDRHPPRRRLRRVRGLPGPQGRHCRPASTPATAPFASRSPARCTASTSAPCAPASGCSSSAAASSASSRSNSPPSPAPRRCSSPATPPSAARGPHRRRTDGGRRGRGARGLAGGADLTLECAGVAETVAEAGALTRAGGRVVVLGVLPCGEQVPIEPFDLLVREVQLHFSYINPFTQTCSPSSSPAGGWRSKPDLAPHSARRGGRDDRQPGPGEVKVVVIPAT